MLFTGKGDKGDTSAFGCDQRFMKSSDLTEALGAVDEINSLVGFCKAKSEDLRFKIYDLRIYDALEQAQQDLFIIQANLAGADKRLSPEKIKNLENIINEVEKELPKIKTFFLSGGTEIGSLLDYARAVARRAERRIVKLSGSGKIDGEILAYMNRLSSFLYAMARFVNFKSGAKEKPPKY
ncbi:MAG: cob(I)yrinic acid a,c-diamide adenosyltransferase [Candidatus Wolfebacteria bacterium]|nr:cob(I)yrinic acid a,c-diamide adenosyltransferase [Candidatus Wolfebacteria bacterium]